MGGRERISAQVDPEREPTPVHHYQHQPEFDQLWIKSDLIKSCLIKYVILIDGVQVWELGSGLVRKSIPTLAVIKIVTFGAEQSPGLPNW